jgi:hypothetical protein
MRKFYPIYEEALVIHDFAPYPSYFLIDEDNFILFFISVLYQILCTGSRSNTHKPNNYYLAEKNIAVNICNSAHFTHVPAIERTILFNLG